MVDNVDRFNDALAARVPKPREPKLDRMLGHMADTDPDLHTAVMAALTDRDPAGQYRVPTVHIEEALRTAGYRISHDSVRRWRRNNEQS